MADLIGTIITNWQLFDIVLNMVILVIVGYMGWSYDRGRRYNYLADRWNVLMNMNIELSNFFDPEKTKEYETWDADDKTKYQQHARMYWGFVEDVIRNDYWWEKWLKKSYMEAYVDTIENIIYLHHAWLDDNKKLFSYPNFSEKLEKKFGEKYLFSWGEISGNGNSKLRKFLTQEFGIDWGESSIKEINDKTISAFNGTNSLSLRLNNEKTNVTIEIYEGKTDKFFAKVKEPWLPWGRSELNIYENKIRKWNPELYRWMSRKNIKK